MFLGNPKCEKQGEMTACLVCLQLSIAGITISQHKEVYIYFPQFMYTSGACLDFANKKALAWGLEHRKDGESFFSGENYRQMCRTYLRCSRGLLENSRQTHAPLLQTDSGWWFLESFQIVTISQEAVVHTCFHTAALLVEGFMRAFLSFLGSVLDFGAGSSC